MITMKFRNLTIVGLSAALAMTLAGCASNPTLNEAASNGQQTTTQSTEQPVQKSPDEDKTVTPVARTPEEELAQPNELLIVDSGWFAVENGMVDFAVEVQNTNATMEAVAPVIHAVAKDADGNVLFEKDVDVPCVLPDSVYYFSMVTGDNNGPTIPGQGSVATPATMEFTIETPEDAWQQTDINIGDIYSIESTGINDTDFGAKEFTGTVTASDDVEGSDQSRVDVILFDDQGHIEGGYFKIVDTEPGTAVDYDVYAIGAPSFASYQVYASPWMDEDA